MTTKRLRPIKKLRRITSGELKLLAKHFERRARGMSAAAELASRRKAELGEKGKTDWKSAGAVKAFLELSHAINDSGRFTDEEYFFHCAMPVERLHEHRWIDGQYDAKLGPILAGLQAVEAKHGLPPGYSWQRGQGPAEYTRLNSRYERILDNELLELFREFGLKRHARLWKRDRKEYNRLREAGRAHIFERSDVEHATAKLVEFYEAEAKLCMKAKAFHAACIMLGSACESLLLLQCIREPVQLAAAKAQLPKSTGLHKGGPTHWNLAQLVRVAKQAGWIADLQTIDVVVKIVSLLSYLQGLRNKVHAGRHVADMPHISIGKEQYDDARAAYLSLRFALDKAAQRK